MRDFASIARMALRYRKTLAASIGCSLAVSILWCANISALYPFLELVIHGKSLGDLVDQRITESETRQDKLSAQVRRLESQAGNNSSAAQRQIDGLKLRLQAEAATTGRLREWRPHLNKWLPQGPMSTIFLVVAVWLVLTTIRGLLCAWNEVLVWRISQETVFVMRSQFYRRTLKMDVADFQKDRVSGLLSRFTHDLNRVILGLNALFGRGIQEPLRILACAAGAAFISWRLLLIALLVAPVGLVLLRVFARAVRRASEDSIQATSKLYGRLAESFHAITIVKVFQREGYERRQLFRVAKEILLRNQSANAYRAFVKPIAETFGSVGIGIAVLAGTYLVVTKGTHVWGVRLSSTPLTPSALLLFYAMLVGTTDSFRKLVEVWVTINRSAAAAKRIQKLMSREVNVTSPGAPLTVSRPVRELAFDQVQFRYGKSQVLCGADLRVGRGESLAIVGSNGCGKTTLVNMIPRFHDPDEGRVMLNGVDLRDIALGELREMIGLVTQETLLFDETVMDNIRYARPTASDDQCIDAARRALAHDFITQQLDEGYQTIVGEKASMISGGQAQRIALARAMLSDPEILILDEATSKIDVENERLIVESLRLSLRDRITIMITHRPAMLAIADRVALMESGRIADVGSHAELLFRCETYRRLFHFEATERLEGFESQSAAAEDSKAA